MLQFKLNKWIKPGLYTTFNRVSVVLLGFVNFFILARILSKNDFGVWVLFTSLISILETLREGFIKQPFIAFLAAAEGEERNKIGSSAFFLNTIYSLVVSILIFLLASLLENFWSASPLATLLKIYAFSNLIFIPFSHFEYLQQAKLDFKGIFLSHLLRSAIPTIYIVYAALSAASVGLLSLAISVLVGNFMGAIACVFFGWELRHSISILPIKNIMDILRFARYSFGTNMASLSIRNMDSWMLGKMLSTESIAMYNPAIRISNLVEIPTLTVANLIFPKMAEGFGSGDHTNAFRLYERSLGLLVALMIPLSIFLFFFSDWIVQIVAGKNYLESGYLLKITAFYTLFIPFGRQFGILLDALRMPKINFYFVLGTAFLNIVINYFFILEWGIAGAAYGTLVTYLIRFVFQQILLNKLFGIRTINVFEFSIQFYIQGYAMAKSIMKNGNKV